MINTIDPFKFAPPPFTPGSLSNLAARYKSSVSNSLWQNTSETTGATANNDPVRRWKDISGNNQHIDAPSDGARPLLITGGSFPVIRFDGSDDYLTKSFTLNNPEHIFIVLKVLTFAANKTILDGTTLNNMRWFMGSTGPDTHSIYAQGAAVAPSSTDSLVTSFHLVELLFNGAGNSTIIVDTGTAASSNQTGSANAGGLTLGAYAGGGQPSNIEVAELCVYSNAKSGDDLTNLRTYFDTEYSLSF